MFFRVRDLEVRAGRFNVELQPGVLDYLDPKIRQGGALKAVGQVELAIAALGEIRVKGHLSVAMEADCDRCLESARFPVDGDFELVYSPMLSGRPSAGGYQEEAVIDEGEAEMGFYDGEGLELNDVLREYVLLALPMQRLCGENCKGICPVCGQNRNQKECACQSAQVDDRWASLKALHH